MSKRQVAVVAVFCSGFCALVYQVVWTRELRLLFGASTAASGAVLAAFAAGLGLGSLLLGRRADVHARPLQLYAYLELGIAASAAASAPLAMLARKIYVGVGGAVALGSVLGGGARIALAALVLAVPTFLMGGTLPAMARALADDEEDPERRRVALLYGANTLGAVGGAMVATFVALEALGTHRTLWAACAVNLAVVLLVLRRARSEAPRDAEVTAVTAEAPATSASLGAAATEATPRRGIVFAAAAVTGFAFFLMELVWYRVLGPLLGGTVFSFGLILSTALLGIGVGGLLGARFFVGRVVRLRTFALVCLLEALTLVVPFAAGDHVALLTVFLRPLGGYGFAPLVGGWMVVAGFVAFLPALFAGMQFPLLISLLGRGRASVGRHVGLAYLFNTGGAVVGSLAGGFGLLPLLGASGAWRFSVGLLLALGAVSLVFDRSGIRRGQLAAGALIAALAVFGVVADGPSAAYRHSGIGSGRVPLDAVSGETPRHRFLRASRADILAAYEGVESGIAIGKQDGIRFVVNGKTDGHAKFDAGTQIGAGLVGALLHSGPVRSSLVIGLGTGSTAGWLGKVESMDRVDVFELEPAIMNVARLSAPFNGAVLDNAKVQVHFGDARELLALTDRRYDLVFSEPSNPYRAGVASLFTTEYYRMVKSHLAEGGLFLQWVQGYETTFATVRVLAATLAEVFPEVELWETQANDLLFVAGDSKRVYDAPTLRTRLAEPTFRDGMIAAWGVDELEGVFGHFVARSGLVKALAKEHADDLNTDDDSVVEFAFARSVGRVGSFNMDAVHVAARARKESLPPIVGPFDFEHMRYERALLTVYPSRSPARPGSALDDDHRERLLAVNAWVAQDPVTAFGLWNLHPRLRPTRLERLMVAELAVLMRAPDAEAHLASLALIAPTDAAVLTFLRQLWGPGGDKSMPAFLGAIERLRKDPWADAELSQALLRAVPALLRVAFASGPPVLEALSVPFVGYLYDAARLARRVDAQRLLGASPDCPRVFAELEPHVPWENATLEFRRECYRATHHPLLARAEADLRAFDAEQEVPFGLGVAFDRPAGRGYLDAPAMSHSAPGPDASAASASTPVLVDGGADAGDASR